MRCLRSLVVLVSLCLLLGAPVASAAEAPSKHAGRESGGLVRILGQLEAFLKAVWENDAGDIDPFGKPLPHAGPPADGSATPSADLGCEIDPFGHCGR